MDSDTTRVRRLFDEAAELGPEERAGFLERECADDPKLRQRVERLLHSLAAATGFLVPSGSSLPEVAGTRIGPYKLLEQIGEGGFGVVFLAEQQSPLVRRVALKIIKLGMDTRQVIARFEAERQALALMDHPNIARVLDAGATEAGRPYFVMELVRGEPITAYCDRNRLSTDARLALFVDVCHAIQHAHQKGVIHRDIKPTNILVTVADGRPIPKVIDFGIAKATSARLTEKTLFTEHRQLIGTPAYMSPEQADTNASDIDTRSDIYSLGVLLYELLTGTTPFEARQLREAAFGEIQRIIREVEPPKPSTRLSTLGDALVAIAAHRQVDPAKLRRLVRGDLDWIVMRCLEKDRGRRYESANGLAVDLARHLGGEPVTAAPPSAVYRLRKFARRHCFGVIAGAALALALGVGLAGTITFALREARQRSLSERRAEETGKVAEFQARMLRGLDAVQMGRRIREVFREQVRAALDRRLVGPYPDWRPMSPQEIDAELQAFDEHAGAAHAVDVARRVLDEDLLARAVEAARREFADQPAVLAQICDAVGSAYLALGMHAQARSVLAQAIELRRSQQDADELAMAGSLAHLGQAQQVLGELVAAESAQREALAIRQRRLGREHADVARSLANLAGVLREGGRSAEAEPLLRQALSIQERLLGAEDPQTLEIMHDLATLLHGRGEREPAEELYRRTLALRRKVLGDADPKTAATLSNLGLLLNEQGDPEAAEPLLREALAAQRARMGDEHEDVASTMQNLALVLESRGDRGGAEQLDREALALQRKLLGDRHPHVALCLNNLGVLLRREARTADAESCLREALAIVRGDAQGDGRYLAMYLHHLAGILLDAESAEEAESLAREAVELYRAHPEWDGSEFRHALAVLAQVCDKAGRKPEALALVSESLELSRKLLPAGSRALARELESRASELSDLGEREQALELEREALTQSRTRGNERETARYLHHLAKLLASGTAADEAERLLLESVALYRAHADWDAREYRHATCCLSELYAASGRKELAVAALRESLVAERRFAKPGTIELVEALERVGYGLMRMDALAECEPCFVEVVEVCRRMHPEGHARTGAECFELGYVRLLLGRPQDAEAPLLEAVECARAHVDEDPNQFASALQKLSRVYSETSRTELAIERICDSVEPQRRVHKPGSAELASALGGVAGELLRLGAAARAEPYLRECVALRETLFPDEHPRSWTKQTARSQLGESLCGQGRFAEAEPLLIAACEALRGDARVPLPAKTKGKDLKREALERVIRLYEAWDQAEPGKGFDARAAEWRQKP